LNVIKEINQLVSEFDEYLGELKELVQAEFINLGVSY
jgi:hypothetical protein